jgi:hypothetical protein
MITNNGAAPLHVSDVTLAGADPNQFVIGTNTCSDTAVASGGGTCAVTVSFEPTSIGAESALLHFTTDATDRPTDVTLAGSGAPATARDTLTVTKSGSGSGAVSSQPLGIDCGGTCSGSFDAGTQVTLSATPASLSTFTGWLGGGCSGVGTCVLTMSGDESVTATFTAATVQPSPQPQPQPQPQSLPQNTMLPAVSGEPKAGKALSCSPGGWSANPIRYSYLWSRDGTPIAGAAGNVYVVRSGDEGLTLTCAVTASNAGGSGAPATSNAVPIPVPRVPHCPCASGRLSGETLGLAKLGMTRGRAHRAYSHSSDHGKRYEDFFCLTPIGVRVGYASPKLLRTLGRRERTYLADRVVWIDTGNGYYALNGIRPGATIAAAGRVMKLGAPFHIGLNDWYFAPNGASTALLKVRGGIVIETGIAYKPITHGRKAQFAFITSFS